MARIQKTTFTSRLADEIAREVGRGVSSVSFADLITTLRQTSNPDRMPLYQLKAGVSGIRIPNLNRNSPASPHVRPTNQQRLQASLSSPTPPSSTPSSPGMLRPSPSTRGLSAIFQVHLNSVDPAGLEAEQLVEWVHSLGKDLSVELMGVYKSRSTVLLFRVPWSLWSRLNGLSGFALVSKTSSGNLL